MPALTEKKNLPPSTFERRGKAYVGHAIAVRLPSGAEIIILAPTAIEVEVAAQGFIYPVNRKLIHKAALIGGKMLDQLDAAGAAPGGPDK
jgi:hypothetical protein